MTSQAIRSAKDRMRPNRERSQVELGGDKHGEADLLEVAGARGGARRFACSG